MKRNVSKSCENDKCMHLFESETVLHGRGAFAICPECGTRNELAVVDVVDGCGQGGQVGREEKVNHCLIYYHCGGIRHCKYAMPLGDLACRFFEGPCCTSSRAAAEAVRVEAELVTDGSVKSEKARCLAAVKNEPECPDEMSDEVFEIWKREMLDKTTLMYALRLLVRMTKEGIIKRIEETDRTDGTDGFVPANKLCPNCKGTGWYGDNGPGRRGNSELALCECTRRKMDTTDGTDKTDRGNKS